LIEKVVDAGRLAPTAWGKQPWEFVVITDADMKSRIADITDYGKFIKNAPACIAVFCEDTKFYLEDGCAATENMLVAATALGLGTCWVAGDKKEYADTVRELLAVPSSYRLVSLIPIGYAKSKPQPKRKRALRNLLHWEKY
jgi:nitroreductase